MIQEHINKEFTYPPSALELGIQGRVFVQFLIDSKGNIGGIRMRGPDRTLEKEAERIVATLPQDDPRETKGKSRFGSI